MSEDAVTDRVEADLDTNENIVDEVSEETRPADAKSQLRELEEEGELAADYLEELLDIIDLDGDLDIDVNNGRAHVSIVSDDGSSSELEKLVGEKGQTLEALQELTRLSVLAKVGNHSRLLLDVNGYRERRRQELVALATEQIESVRKTGESVKLPPMSSFERKIVHDVVAEQELASESFGQGADRHIVISINEN